MLLMDIPPFTRGEPLSASQFITQFQFDYILLALHQEIYKTFYIGYATMFEAIAHIFKTPSVPTSEAVLFAALGINAGAVQFYLGKGGKVEYALDAVVDTAREQSTLGDGTFEETFDIEEGDLGGGDRLGYRELGACRNDLEFGIVKWNVGLQGRWGPYEEDDDGMDLDEDDYNSD
jgi:hypothetical protein